jgi:hypothetical protein
MKEYRGGMQKGYVWGEWLFCWCGDSMLSMGTGFRRDDGIEDGW